MQDPKGNYYGHTGIEMQFTAWFHPLFFAVYPILYLYSANFGEVQFIDASIPMGAGFVIALLLLVCMRKLTGDAWRASVLVTGACFSFYAYGAFDSLMISLNSGPAIRDVWLPGFWFVAFIAGEVVVWRHRAPLHKVVAFLNAMALVLMLMVVSSLSLSVFESHTRFARVEGAESGFVPDVPDGSPLPDVYYLILDGYARQDILQDIYAADNSEFIEYLARHGFYVASESYANYPQTYLSLAGSLNYSYLDDLAARYHDQNSVEPLISMVQNSRFSSMLKKAGYTTVAYSSGYSGTELRNADIYLSRTLMGREFFNTLINSTFLVALKLPFFDMAVSQADIHRNRIRETLASLGEVKLPAGPVFVFAHITCPHPPFVFGADGEELNTGERFHIQDGSHWGNDAAAYRRQYRDQLAYLTRLVKNMLHSLLADRSRQRIVILQSDHGPGSVLDWQNPEKTDLRERFAILNAVRFPDRDYRDLYPQIGPINTMRVVMNRFLRDKLPRLPDRSYFAPWFGRFRFTEITNRLPTVSQR